jgi:hypothetical protein
MQKSLVFFDEGHENTNGAGGVFLDFAVMLEHPQPISGFLHYLVGEPSRTRLTYPSERTTAGTGPQSWRDLWRRKYASFEQRSWVELDVDGGIKSWPSMFCTSDIGQFHKIRVFGELPGETAESLPQFQIQTQENLEDRALVMKYMHDRLGLDMTQFKGAPVKGGNRPLTGLTLAADGSFANGDKFTGVVHVVEHIRHRIHACEVFWMATKVGHDRLPDSLFPLSSFHPEKDRARGPFVERIQLA